MNIHELPRKFRKNVEKQSEQIRYCLIQAKEYFDASRHVSMATKPLLQYYGVMSLALAEVLLKGTGDQSLDRARGEHSHHGLDFKLDQDASKLHDLQLSAGALRAVPLEKGGGNRFGTFELWHQVAREAPACGEATTDHGRGRNSAGCRVIFSPADERLARVPSAGLTLLDCIRSIPDMKHYLESIDEVSDLVRAGVSTIISPNERATVSIVFQPNDEEILSECYELISAMPENVNDIEIEYFPSGLAMIFTQTANNNIQLNFPIASQIEQKWVLFHTKVQCLNEFGNYYVASYILGNYARYFPDKWMIDVEKSSPLAMMSWALSEFIEERVSLLTLSEFSRKSYLYVE